MATQELFSFTCGGRMTKSKGVAASIAPLAVGVFFVLSPASAALAADECGAQVAGPDIVNCTVGNYGSGITYSATDGMELVIDGANVINAPVSVEATSGTSAIITATDVGTLTVGAGAAAPALFADSNSASSGATVNLGGGTVSGGSILGSVTARVQAGANDAVASMSGGAIDDSTAAGIGLIAENIAAGGASVTLSGGAITMSGLDGIGVKSHINSPTSTGNASLYMTAGDVVTSGDRGFGLEVETHGLGSVLADVSGGTIATQGLDAYGIWARGSGTSGTSAVDLLFSGTASVTTSGVNAHALYATNGFDGPASGTVSTVISGGTIVASGAGAFGSYTYGIRDSAVNFLMSAGALSSSSYGATVRTDGLGAATASMTGGTITSGDVGLSAGGIGAGSALVSMSGGGVSTAKKGVYAISQVSGDATVDFSGGTVSTTGANADGVAADNMGATGNAYVNLSGTAQVDTSGAYSSGLRAQVAEVNATGDAVVTIAGGSVTTLGDTSLGATAETLGGSGAASIAMSGGAISTSGVNSSGLSAYTNNGVGTTSLNVTGGTIDVAGSGFGAVSEIDNVSNAATATATLAGGSITLAGSNGSGLAAITSGTGNAFAVLDSGSVTTTGSAPGVAAAVLNSGGGGVARVTMNGGTITTSADYTTPVPVSGVYVVNQGSGLAEAVINNGTVASSGLNADGIRIEAAAGYSVNVGGSANIVSGTGTGAAIRTVSAAGTTGAITVGAGATVDATAGAQAIADEAGDAVVDVAGTVAGKIHLGLGSDALKFTSTADLSKLVDINGGSSGGTDLDQVTIQDMTNTASLSASRITNFDQFVVDNSTVNLAGSSLLVDNGTQGTDFSLTNNSVLNASNILDVQGSLSVLSGSVLNAGDTLSVSGDMSVGANSSFTSANVTTNGVFAVSGNLTNDGTISLQNGGSGDVLNVNGNYSGSGTLAMEVDLAAGTSDSLVIAGDVLGSSVLNITNLSSGASSGADVNLITVSGSSNASSFITSGSIRAGAYDYMLNYANSGLKLTSALNSDGATYASFPVALSGLNMASGLTSRTNGRRIFSPAAPTNSTVSTKSMSPAGATWAGEYLSNTESWASVTGDRLSATLANGDMIKRTTAGIQAGVDVDVELDAPGRLIAGISTHTERSNANITSSLGSGSITTESLGIGGALTWFAENGSYFDAQGQLSWAETDASSNNVNLVAGHKTNSAMLSFEVGQRFADGRGGAFVPQAQMTFGRTNAGQFTDSIGNTVILGTQESTTARIGLAYEYDVASASGTPISGYFIGNVFHDYSQASTVTVSGATLSADVEKTWGEIGLGNTIGLENGGKLYGEMAYRAPLGKNATQSNGLNGLRLGAGFRIQF